MASQGVNNLQRWCKQNTLGYSGVNIRNMTSSWRNGLAFCALIHHFRPDLIDFESLKKDDVFHNNKLAFEVAEKELGIVAFLDPRDMVAMKTPDRLSVITYVQQYYHHFSKMACPEEKLQVDAHNDKKSVSSESEGTDKENHGLFEEMPSKCHICGNKVHLVERIIEDGNVFHRHCHRKCSLRRLYGAPNQSFSVLQHKTTTPKTQPLNGMSQDNKSVEENINKGNSLASTIDFLSTSSETSDEDEDDGMTSEDALDGKVSADESLVPTAAVAAEKTESSSGKLEQSQIEVNVKVVEPNPFLDETDDIAGDDKNQQASCEDSNLFSDMKPVDPSKNQKPSPKDQASSSTTVPLLQELPSAKARSVRPKREPQPTSSNTPTNPFEEEEEESCNSNPFGVEEEKEASNNNNPFGDDEEEDVVESASNNASSLNPFGDEEEHVTKSHSKLSQSSSFNPFLEEGEVEEASKPPVPPTTRRKARAPPPPPSATARKQVITDKGSDGSTVIRNKPPPVPAPRKKVKAPNWKEEVAKKMEEANKQNLQNEKFVSVQPSPVTAEKKKNSTSGSRRKAAVKPARVAPGFGFPLVKREIKASEEEKITENDLLDELEAIDGKLKELEHRGIQLENILRNAMSPGSEWKADSDQLLKEWFEVVQEKNRLVRSETLLMYQMQEQKLEEEHAEIEFRIRKLMNKPEKDRTDEEKEEEQKLLDNLVKVVERRNKIILSIEEQRVREEEEEEAYSVIKEVKRQSLSSVDTSASKEHKKKKKKLKVKKMFKKSKKNKESNAVSEEKSEEKVKEKSSSRLSLRKKN